MTHRNFSDSLADVDATVEDLLHTNACWLIAGNCPTLWNSKIKHHDISPLQIKFEATKKEQNIAYLFGHINWFEKIVLIKKHNLSFFPCCKEHFDKMK